MPLLQGDVLEMTMRIKRKRSKRVVLDDYICDVFILIGALMDALQSHGGS